MKDQQIAPLLSTLAAKLDAYQALRASNAAFEAVDFNPFTYIRPDENRLSWMIGDLLDPRGSHGQGKLFLDRFLQTMGLDDLAGTSTAQVRLEDRTDALDSPRRIDVVVRGDTWIVGIENKPWAQDQQLQVSDYLLQLQRSGASRFHLLYLTKDGCRPSERSILASQCESALASRDLLILSYAKIADWLDLCIASCRADGVAWFLRYFQRFVNRSLLGKLPAEENAMIVETVMDPSSPGHLPAALELIRARDALRTELMRRLMSTIESRLPPDWSICRNIVKDGMLGIRVPGIAGGYFGLESERRSRRDYWFYGIKRDDDVTSASQRSLNKLCEKLRLHGSGKPTEWWPYWRWFDGLCEPDPRESANWDASVQPWLDMHSGKMADDLLARTGELHRILMTI